MENLPEYKSEKFVCPHCNVLAKQEWIDRANVYEICQTICDESFFQYRKNIESFLESYFKNFLDYVKSKTLPYAVGKIIPKNLSLSFCHNCKNYILWVNEEMVFPRTVPIEPPNEDLNDDIKAFYNEAKLIFNDSPKGAAALLRLALQKLLKQLGMDGKNINDDIGKLVREKKIPIKIQKALDIVRVVGNNAVHPGEINLDDNKEIALILFKILNFIANELITKPKELNNLYEEIIPENIKKSIKKRDKN